MRDDAVDRAIGDVARAMTAGEPSGELRARVMARIAAPDARPTASRSFVGVSRVVLAAAAVVLVAVVAYRANVRRPGPARPKTSTAALRMPGPSERRPEPSERGPEPSERRPGSSERRPLSKRRPGPSGPGAQAFARDSIPPSSVDALAPPPIDIAPIAVDDLSAVPLAVMPLDTITPIAVAPLGEGDHR